MSLFSDVCDAWMTALTALSGLTAVPAARQHKYTPWSVEAIQANVGERHVAIWPNSEAETTGPLTTIGDRLAQQTYTVLVWENIGYDTSRRMDDEDAGKAWLTVHETIRNAMMTRTNWQLGSSTIMAKAPYLGVRFDRIGDCRVMEITMRIDVPLNVI